MLRAPPDPLDEVLGLATALDTRVNDVRDLVHLVRLGFLFHRFVVVSLSAVVRLSTGSVFAAVGMPVDS